MAQPVDQPGQARREGDVGFVDVAGAGFLPNQCQQCGRRLGDEGCADQAGRAFQRVRQLFRRVHVVAFECRVDLLEIEFVPLEEELDDLPELLLVAANARQTVCHVESGD